MAKLLQSRLYYTATISGSSADISDVLMNDEVLSVNNHEVGNMTLKQVQGIIDHSVKRGQIELKIRRKPDEGNSQGHQIN